jgi:hypothetical protein
MTSAQAPDRPAILPVNPDSIPAELRSIDAWVGWRLVWNPLTRRWTKRPINLRTGGLAATDNPSTWSTFDFAVSHYLQMGLDGIGLCRTGDQLFIDLDGVLDERSTLRTFPWAHRILSTVGTQAYIEISVLGKGLHAICYAATPLPKNGGRQHNVPGLDHVGYGFYDDNRYFTFSGAVHPQSGSICTLDLTALHAELFPVVPPRNGTSYQATPSLGDPELLEKARSAKNGAKFARLFAGRWEDDYPTQSEADMALCCHLAFWCGNDPARIEALFRQSGLYRDKWEAREDYRARTIERAINLTPEPYSPPASVYLGAVKKDDAPPPPQGGPQSDEPPDSSPINWGVTWPAPLEPEALYGLAGDIVRAIEPHTEADVAAILTQLLVGFGNMIGRSPYFVAGADRHYGNLSLVLSGNTSRGRKGSAWSRVRSFLDDADPDWSRRCIQSGLSSGEGLIWAVRDPIEEVRPIKDPTTRRVLRHESVITDGGVGDKRLLVIESEFARVLQVADRDANTLSAVIRQAWDSGTLRVMTRNRPASATGAHISIIGHITKDELLKTLSTTEAGNGFGNRILWTCVQRSKLLPDGGEFHTVDVNPLIDRLENAVRFARTAGQLTRDQEAAEMWRDVYGHLTADRFGMFGAVTSRAEAQTLRLSLLYALLDCSPKVCARHLAAALAVWRYCDDSAKFIFGESLGDETADTILRALRGCPGGLTRLDISAILGRHKKSDEISRALKVLVRYGLARPEMKEETGGRPRETWFATSKFGR